MKTAYCSSSKLNGNNHGIVVPAWHSSPLAQVQFHPSISK